MADHPPSCELHPGSARYPAAVATALGDKAPSLHILGNLTLLNLPGIGFCGSRKASDKSLETAVDCAEQAAEAGFTVISGNAAGIDAAAHRAALKAGGTTILVLPEGIDRFRVRKDLRAVWDWDRVLVISQYEPAAIWRADRAMTRNRVIIALSRAMIVIEAGTTGGTLNAGLSTLTAGKPLFVAVYEHMEDTAPGNARLLGRGGIRLSRSRTTGKANLNAVRSAVERRARAPRAAAQLPLL